MTTSTIRHKLADLPTASDALAELCQPFVRDAEFSPYCVEVQPVRIPTAARRCLAHREHMTEVLQYHHVEQLTVNVQEFQQDGDWYSRRITLVTDHTKKLVECGLVRMDFRYMSPQVRDEILARRTPLGAILIQHDVLRWIEPLWFVQLPPGSDVMKLFGQHNTEPVWGRIAVIYCNGEPAIDLLEIVVNT
jgi:chorismate-pyruvate lyase